METNTRGGTRRITSGRLGLVCGILALVVSLGAPSEAAKLINGKLLKNNSVAGKKLKNSTITGAKVKADTLTGSDIDESTLKGVLKTGDVAAYGAALEELVVLGAASSFTSVVSKTFTAPANGVLYITGSIAAQDHPSPGVGGLSYRLRLDSTPLTSSSTRILEFAVAGYESGAATGVVPVTKGAHTVHLDADAGSASSAVRAREVSVLFVPNGQGFTPPA